MYYHPTPDLRRTELITRPIQLQTETEVCSFDIIITLVVYVLAVVAQ